MSSTRTNDPDTVRDEVRAGYAAIATGRAGCCRDACGGEPTGARVGYDDAELGAVPDGADMGLSCGNPTALAALRPGEVVLDLGSGGGLDAFIAGPRVGPTGRVVGVDMTPEMIRKARAGLAVYRERTGLDNVEFRLGEIEQLPVEGASVDVVISNCVINLSPDKARVWREIARVLAPGGRVAISDVALRRPLPAAVRERITSWVGCVAGASTIDEIRAAAAAAGITDLEISAEPGPVCALEDVQDPLYREIASHLPEGEALADYVTSVRITGSSPRPHTAAV